jgi:hypothetical protein
MEMETTGIGKNMALQAVYGSAGLRDLFFYMFKRSQRL